MIIENEVLYNIWKDRYRKGNETIDENIKRVAKYIALNKEEENDFCNVMNNGYFFPAGRTMSNSGIGNQLTLGNCFLEGHKVFTKDGFKNIEDIQIGEYVLTDRNVFKQVNNVMISKHEGDIYEINPTYSLDKIRCTPNHKFLTDNRDWVKAEDLRIACKNDTKNYKIKSDFLKLMNNEVEEEVITTIDILDYLGNVENIRYDECFVWRETIIPNPNNSNKTITISSKTRIKRYIKLDSEMSYLIGNWIGDGFTSYHHNKDDNGTFGIVFNEKEYHRKDVLKGIILDKFGIDIKESKDEKQHTIMLRTSNIILGNLFVNLCGLHNDEKKIPKCLMQNNDIGMSLLMGLLDTDGTVKKQGNVSITLKNKQLLESIQLLSFRMNLYCNLKDRETSYALKNGEKAMAYEINYDIYSSNKIKERLDKVYNDNRLEYKKFSTKTFRLKDGDFYTRIRDIKVIKNQSVKVYNLSVLDIHSYTVNGVVAHNCFTLNFVEDSIVDIFDKVKMGALTQKAGGGTGYEFSKIRPNGTPTSNDAIASGVVSFMEVFNAQTSCILQGGRRGANMSVLSVRHPDILEYINAKSYEEGKLVHFNMSVMVDDEFMLAVKNDSDFNLHYPVYDDKGFIIKDESKWQIKKTIKAKELWDIIMKKAYNNGEPGVLFYENINRDNNTYYIETIINTNPCGEYLSGLLYGNDLDSSQYKGACNLGSIFVQNLVLHPFTNEACIDLQELQNTIRVAVRMLDNIIDINKFPHEHYENYQKSLRTIGLGISGLADAMCMLGITYGSKESVEFTDNLMNFITSEAYYSSTLLSKEKGAFPYLDKEKFIQSGFIQKHLKRGDKIWEDVVENIDKYGIRNARLISVAPTGTLSLTFGNNCSSGLEPIFSLEYDRKVKMGGQSDDNVKIVKMQDYAYKLWQETDNKTVSKDVFVTAMDLPVSSHIDILSTVAYHTDMSCSKTINVPTDYPFEDCKNIYMRAWKEGIKGCTIFRPNEIRQGILISPESKEELKTESDLKRGDWKPLADDTIYIKKPLNIGCGKLKLFIGYSPSENSIQDLYIKKAGNGGCTHNIEAVAVALSAVYRLGGSTKNIEKAFSGLGGCNSFLQSRMKGEKLSKGSSCATSILNILKQMESEFNLKPVTAEIVKNIESNTNDNHNIFTEEEKLYLKENGETSFANRYKKCPLCGEKLEFTSGCLTCQSCGFSKC